MKNQCTHCGQEYNEEVHVCKPVTGIEIAANKVSDDLSTLRNVAAARSDNVTEDTESAYQMANKAAAEKLETLTKVVDKHTDNEAIKEANELVERLDENCISGEGTISRIIDIIKRQERQIKNLKDLQFGSGNIADWTDRWMSCKICGGEIPYGHQEKCYIYEQEKKIKELQERITFLEGELSYWFKEASDGFGEDDEES